MNIELISHPLCPFVHRSAIQLREKGVPFTSRHVNMKNKPAWFLNLSPRGMVPVLVVQSEDGAPKTALFESAIVNEYLDETHAPRLLPEDPLERARLRGFAEVATNLFSSMVDVVFGLTEEKWREGRAAANRVLGRIEREIRGPFFHGDLFGLVDIAFAPALYRFALIARRTGLGIVDGTPELNAWIDRILARPTVHETVVPGFAERFEAGLRERGAWIAGRFPEVGT